MYSNHRDHKYIVFEKTVRFDRAVDENEIPDNTDVIS